MHTRLRIINNMYTPIQIGLPHETKDSIEYTEFTPEKISNDIVYCFWTLHSKQKLDKDFQYLVLPDGCIDIIFDISPTPDSPGALIMSSGIVATPLNLGRSFAYVGIRMQPGAWLKAPVESMGQSVQLDSLGGQGLEQLRSKLNSAMTPDNLQILENFALTLAEQSIIGENRLIQHILKHPLATVDDLIAISGYSRRQIQRLIRERTGYSPHDFIRIIRFQKALTQMKADDYADQSHFIRDFKRVTGITPGEFKVTYLF